MAKLSDAAKEYEQKGKHTCIECGKKLKAYPTKRCWDCHVIFYKENYDISGENNPLWAGDNPSYIALHRWVRRNKKKINICEICNLKPSEDLANISGEYKRDVDDYKWVCKKCHRKMDGKNNKLKEKYIKKYNLNKLKEE